MPICQRSRCHSICVLFKINCKFTLLNNIIDKNQPIFGFQWTVCVIVFFITCLNALIKHRENDKPKKSRRQCHKAAGGKCPPPQDLLIFLEKRVFPAICLHFICKRWLHFCSPVRNKTHIPLTSKIVWRDNSWMQELCFSHHWRCLPVLFKSLNSFSSSFFLRVYIPLL